MFPTTFRTLSLIALALTATPLTAPAQIWDRLTNPKVTVNVKHAPGLGIKVSKIAFGPSRGAKSNELVDALVQDFVQSGIEVLDRQHVDALLAEHRFTTSGYVDQRSAAELGKILGPVALIFIDVQRAATEQKRLYEDWKDSKGYMHRRYISRTQAYLKASVQTVDLATGRIFQAVTLDYSPKQENQSIDRCCTEYPSEFTVLDDAMKSAVMEVHRLFATWEEPTTLYFFDDKTCNLKAAYSMLKAGDTEGVLGESMRNLESCQGAPEVKAKVLAHAQYNVGMAHMIAERYDEALRYFSDAQRTDASGIFEETMQRARRMKDVAESRRRVETRAAIAATASNVRAEAPALTSRREESARPASDSAGTIEERIRRVDELFRKKLITRGEYENKRAELLKQL